MATQGLRTKSSAHELLVSRLKEVMRARGWSARHWSKEAGCGVDAIRNIQRDRSNSPRIDTLEKLARYAGPNITVGWLRGETDLGGPSFEAEPLHPDAAIQGRLPLIGYIGAGDVVHHFGISEVRETVPAPPGLTRGIAAQVRGGSMLPVYRPDEIVIGREHEGLTEQLAGKDCFVQVQGGPLYLKILRKGPRHTFHLESYNPSVSRIEHQLVEWAAPVAWVKRS